MRHPLKELQILVGQRSECASRTGRLKKERKFSEKNTKIRERKKEREMARLSHSVNKFSINNSAHLAWSRDLPGFCLTATANESSNECEETPWLRTSRKGVSTELPTM